jgi:WD40 repeat protein
MQITALCLLADGRLASASRDGAILLWDVASGAECARLKGHEHEVNVLCSVPDGRLASAAFDRTIRLWDVATGADCARLEVYASVQCLAAISPNRLVAGDTLGRLHWLEIVD